MFSALYPASRRATRKALLFAFCAGVPLALGAPALAEGEDDAAVAELVVTAPIRESLEKSLAVQREADNLVNVIAADTIGRFPDATAAGALSRLPAVAVQRDQGQERYIQVRGAPARWTNVAFDGVNVLGAEDRVFRFDSVPASVISQLELNKTLTPAMPAEALAGRVNIRTYSPLENPGFKVSADAGRGGSDLSDGPVESYGLRVSWANETFGVMLGASAFQFAQDTDNYEPRFDAVGMREVRFAKYKLIRETNAVNGKLEWRINDDNTVRLTGLYSEFLDDEERNQYTFNFAGGTGTRTPTSGSLVAVPVAGLFEKGGYATKNKIIIAHGDHKVADWTIAWDLGHAESTFEQNLPLVSQSQSNPLFRPSLTFTAGEAGVPVITLFDTALNAQGQRVFGAQRTSLNQQAFDTEALVVFGQFIEQKDNFLKADMGREWSSFGAEAKFEAGVQYNDRGFDDPGNVAYLRPNGTAGTVLARPTAAALNVPWTPLAFITSTSAIGNVNTGFQANFIDNPALGRQYDALVAALVAANAAGGTNPVPRSDPSLANTVEEKVLAGYVQNTWRWDRHTLLAGVRIERTEVASEGAARVGATLTPISLGTEDTFVFPSLHYTFDLNDDVKLRAAYISGSARPSFIDARATVSINDAVPGSVNGGNPFLKPERAQGFDFSAEWYFAPAALLSANFFYRDVKDVLFDATDLVTDDRFNFNGVNRRGYTYTTTLNGGEGDLQGFELAYYHPWTFLPGPLSGLGFQGSLTFLDGSFEVGGGRSSAFPGTSDRIFSGSIFYEKYGLSLRLGYQHRTEWLDELSPGAATNDIYWDAQQRVEFSGRYQVNKNISVYVDVNNITNERGLRYQGTKAQPYELEYFGTRYLAGVRATF
ncbi:TonB-dependent receptor [Phenylobacterium sp.]|uniref:TonB-dependent receptor n=1 Tax=Phenylobacterium sp. TaxID=1871053 RepID=UPI00286BCC03|nr:TonB-dependent receptor [Phenylobacterium sp.]